jgi:hypothetical protein
MADTVVASETVNGVVEIAVQGMGKEANGGYVIHLDAAGGIRVSYDFSSNSKINPRQWGMVFFAPKEFVTLNWQRTAQWSVYPADHIGRAAGTATARVATDNKPYAAKRPGNLWSLDATGLGGNDFSSTKAAIREASLKGRSGKLRVLSDGHQSVRAFRDGEQTGWLVTGFQTGGGDSFFDKHLVEERKPLNTGSKIADTITLQLTD